MTKPMKKLVEVLADKQALIERALTLVLEKIDTTLAQSDRCTIALSGGSTPKPLYEALSSQPLDWGKIHIFWGDERYVSPDHPDSNQRMARLAWLDRVPIPPDNLHPMPTASQDPALDAVKCENEIRQWFGVLAPHLPIFDIVLLGMGDDGHTASLFPHTEALTVIDRCITVGDKDGQPRLTFTAPLINQSRTVIFVVAGESKRPALRQIFAPTADPMAYPSRLIEPEGELWWLLDRSAGEEL
jgi:6-phosphogluconolactonase